MITSLRIARDVGVALTSALLLAPLANCSSSEPVDAFATDRVTAAATAPVTIRPVRGTTKCIDVDGWNQNNGTRAILWDCHAGANQQFTYQDGALRVFGNKCLDVPNGANANGTRLQIWDCVAGERNQQWVRDGQQWKWAGTNKCIDLPWGEARDGNFLQIWDCVGNDYQRWETRNVGGGTTGATTGSTTGGSGVDAACTLPQLQKCQCPADMYCCAADGGCFDSKDKVVYTTCKDRPQDACSMAGQAGGPGTGPGTEPLPTGLRIKSNCAEPIWVAHSNNLNAPQNVRLARGQQYDYNIPAGGLDATRFWPKQECDGNGRNCAIGDNGEGGGVPCPANGCQPPIDSKVEITFGRNGNWYNLSQVDGFTLPFKVVPKGVGAGAIGCVPSDCAALTLDHCPSGEDIQGYGSQDLRVRDRAGKVIGCMAPCKKFNYPSPWGLGQPEDRDPGLHLCCPTDPNRVNNGTCTIANKCMTPDTCRDRRDPLSVEHTDYVAAVRSACPSVYSYSYDDAAGLHACPGNTQFEVTFCP